MNQGNKNYSFLSKRELRTVEKFAEVFIEGQKEAISPRDVALNIDAQLDRTQSKRKNGVKLILFLIEYIMPLFSLRPPFSRLSAKTRKKLIQSKLAKARRVRFLKDLFRVKALFLSGYYGDKRVFDSINFVPVEKRPRYEPDKFRRLEVEPVNIYTPDENEINTEICVIGSGAGGAVVAYNAAAAGKNVVLLEAGMYIRAEEMNHDEGAMTAKLYKEGGLQTTVDFDMSILQGKILGGTTVINNAICFRLKDNELYNTNNSDIFEVWRDLGANVDERKLGEAYDRVEKFIHVQRIPQDIAGENANILINGWENLVSSGQGDKNFKYGLFRKNYNQCLGCGYCNFGCPYARKSSMLETYIPAASKNGAKVIAECHAVKIERNRTKASGVHCKYRDGRNLFIRAKEIVVSCGAIGSSVLLMKSGIRKNVGERFSFNAGTPMLAKFSKEINGFDGVQMATYIDSGEFLLETNIGPPLAFAVTVPGWFNSHFERMKAYNRFASVGVVIGTEANARVQRSAFFRDLIGPVKYEMTKADLEKMKRGMILLAKVFFAAGAECVYPTTFVDLEIKKSNDVEDLINKHVQKPDDIILNSSHPQGGNIMSDDKKIGVVDSQFKVHGFDNLFVCDATVFPTTIGINPQLTIMAMADYFSHLDVLE